MLHEDYVVHKFGGSSLANAERFRAVKGYLTNDNEIVVVSAPQGTTNRLIGLLDKAKRKADYTADLIDLKDDITAIGNELLDNRNIEELNNKLKTDFEDIAGMLHTVYQVRDYSCEIHDKITGFGEQWSAQLLRYSYPENAGVYYLNAADVVVVNNKNDNIEIDWDASGKLLEQELQQRPFKKLIVTGYIASTEDHKQITLGSNGSDFSAAIFARLFAAKELIIWTDVEGIMSANPRMVPAAFVLDSISYKEAFELAHFGASVLHPKTITPAISANIPITIKSSYNSKARGTCISNNYEQSNYLIRGLTSVDDVAIINIEGTAMAGASQITARVFQILSDINIPVILISQASSEHSICIAIDTHNAQIALESLQQDLHYEIRQNFIEKITINRDCAIVAAVGENMVGTPGITAKLTQSLLNANVNIRAIAQGSSERNISIAIDKEDVKKALRTIHSGFYLSKKTISVGVIGPGSIGGTLLDQINTELEKLRKNHDVNVCVRGIMNSRKMLLDEKQIDLDNWKKSLNEVEAAPDFETFTNHIVSDEIPHAVIIDCTAHQLIADQYQMFACKGAHIITPNKKANTGNIDSYHALKALCQKKQRHFLYETNVCAGLPVIKTLQDLVQTGDEIIEIQGVFSGTLSYIFSALSNGASFSDAVLDAKNKGYTEPDPRDDLTGMDVARKVICLARELGFNASIEDFAVQDLIPEELKDLSIEEFTEKLPEFDSIIGESILGLGSNNTNKVSNNTENDLLGKEITSAQNKIVFYTGTINSNGEISVGVKSFDSDHPFSQLRKTDNMVICKTNRYHDQPLIIQGPGAGAEVTAAGVFADLLRLVSLVS